MDSLIRNVEKHLESLGYNLDLRAKGFGAGHEKLLKFVVRKHLGGLIHSACFVMKGSVLEHLHFSNTLNSESTLIRCHVDENGDLLIEAWYPGPYGKPSYRRFIEMWHADTALILAHDASPNFLV